MNSAHSGSVRRSGRQPRGNVSRMLTQPDWREVETSPDTDDDHAMVAHIDTMIMAGQSQQACCFAVSNCLTPHVPPLLYRMWTANRIDTEGLRDALPEAWIQNQTPMRYLGERAWLRMFKATGLLRRVQSSSHGQSPYPMELDEQLPPEPITVWRGAAVGRGRGMSWSLFHDCALDFAQTVADRDGTAGLYRTSVPTRAVLAMFADWKEQEVVINPDYLRGRLRIDAIVAESEEAAARR